MRNKEIKETIKEFKREKKENSEERRKNRVVVPNQASFLVKLHLNTVY